MAQSIKKFSPWENIDAWLQGQIERILLGFIDKSQSVSVTTSGSADTEGAVEHGLRVVPTGYIVISRNKAAHIYDGTTAWTNEFIYVRSDIVTVVATLLIF